MLYNLFLIVNYTTDIWLSLILNMTCLYHLENDNVLHINSIYKLWKWSGDREWVGYLKPYTNPSTHVPHSHQNPIEYYLVSREVSIGDSRSG